VLRVSHSLHNFCFAPVIPFVPPQYDGAQDCLKMVKRLWRFPYFVKGKKVHGIKTSKMRLQSSDFCPSVEDSPSVEDKSLSS
jgi:hypothetical protein